MPWLGLAAVLGWNYQRHLTGRSTICSTFRRHVPRWIMPAAWGVFSYGMIEHLLAGYVRDTDARR